MGRKDKISSEVKIKYVEQYLEGKLGHNEAANRSGSFWQDIRHLGCEIQGRGGQGASCTETEQEVPGMAEEGCRRGVSQRRMLACFHLREICNLISPSSQELDKGI